MKEVLQAILAMEQPVVFIAVMMIAFCPSAVVLYFKKLNRWVKTVTVLVFGESGAILLWLLSVEAKNANMSGLLPNCSIVAAIMAVLVLAYAVFGHIRNWKISKWPNWTKKDQ